MQALLQGLGKLNDYLSWRIAGTFLKQSVYDYDFTYLSARIVKLGIYLQL